ncbi:MAG: PQQ-binding-like beta-propeller repeat protein, partial [Fuerstiella sp.]
AMSNRITRRNSIAAAAGSLAALGLSKFAIANDEVTSATTPAISKAAATPVTPPTDTSWASFRNGAAQRGIAKSALSKDPQLKWEVASRDGWIATCAIVGNHVYAPALFGYLHCFDKETGAELWKYRSIDNPDEKKFAPGFKAAPLVSATAVYVGDEDGVLHAIDRSTGKLLWKYSTDAEIAGGVAVYNDNILLASHDAFLYCLNKAGEEQWKFQTNDRINCSPAVVETFSFVSGCDEHLRVIDLTNGSEVRDVPMGSYMIASPAVVDEMLYVGSHAGDVAGVNWKTGDIKWRYKATRELPFHASAAVTDDLVLVGGHDKHMHAIDRTTGERRWLFATKARIECSAAVVDNRLFFGSGDGNVYGLSVEDGTEVWKYNAGKPVNAGVAIGEGCLVVGEDSSNGRLRCFA